MSIMLVRKCITAPVARAFSTSRGCLNEAFDESAQGLNHFVEYLQTPPRLRTLLYDPAKAERVMRLRIPNPKFNALTGAEKRKLSDEEYYFQPRNKGEHFPPRELELNRILEASFPSAESLAENLPKVKALIVDINSGYQEYLTTNHLINLLSKFAELNQVPQGLDFTEKKNKYFLRPLIAEEKWITRDLAATKPKFALLASRIEIQRLQLFTNLLRFHYYAQNPAGENVVQEITKAETLHKEFTEYNFGTDPTAAEDAELTLFNSLLKYAIAAQAQVPAAILQQLSTEIVAHAAVSQDRLAAVIANAQDAKFPHSIGTGLLAIKVFQDTLAQHGDAALTALNAEVLVPYLQKSSVAHAEELSAVVDLFENKFKFAAESEAEVETKDK